MLSRTILCAVCLWALCLSACFATPLSGDQRSVDLSGPDIAILRDPQGSLNIADVASPEMAAQFQTNARAPALGYTEDTIWLRIVLQRSTEAPSQWLLELSNSFINDLRFFAPLDHGFAEQQAGDRFAFARRKFAFHTPVFIADLPDTRPHTFYVRLQSDSSLSSQLRLWQPTALHEAGQKELLLLGIAMGTVALSLLVSVMQWYLSRESLLQLFGGLALTILVYLPSQLGLMAQFVFPNFPLAADLLVPWTQALAVALIVLVLERTLHTREAYPRMGRMLQLGAYACLAIPLTREVGLYSLVGGPALQILLLIGILITSWISVMQWRRRVRGAGPMLAAHIVLVIPLVIQRGMYMGLVPANMLTGATWIPTLLVFLFFAQTAVMVDTRAGRRDKEAIHNEIQIARKIAHNEQQLREEQSLFFSFVAHELRSPLGVIVLGLKNLSRELVGLGDPARERLIRVNRAADRMGALIENHLTLQRLKSGHFQPQTASAHPQLAAEEALEQVRANYPHRLFILQGGAYVSMWVEMDIELIVLALSNLLINAAKYSPDGGPVVLDISLDHQLHYRVMDKGSGISAKDQEKIFAPYNRASMADSAQGFGIGLAIAQNVAAAHGGTLHYAHRPEGGSMFTLSIPLVAPRPMDAV